MITREQIVEDRKSLMGELNTARSQRVALEAELQRVETAIEQMTGMVILCDKWLNISASQVEALGDEAK